MRAEIADGRAAVARFELLLSAAGQELLAGLPAAAVPRHEQLRLGSSLRQRYPAELVAAALGQHELRLAARVKFSRAMEMYFTRPGLEQASAEVVASHRASRYAGSARVADLCCGIGGDLLALAGSHQVLAVDRDPLALRVARANAEVCGVAAAVTAREADVRDADLAGVDAVFTDPARRRGRGRLPTGASEPPLAWCLGLAERVARVGIKTAPGVPRSAVPAGWELEFVAVGRDLKEATAWSPALATAATRATVLPGGHALTPAPGEPVPVRDPGEFLLDPNPAVTRAGLVAELARLTGCWQIDPKIAFLSCADAVATPFARTLRVIDSGPWNERQLPARLRALDVGAADIRRRGLAGDVEGLHRRLRLTGTRRVTLVMTRVRDRPWGLVCVDVAEATDGPRSG
ncbi:MAG TPA: methyltransferase domain-containing protein [Streptosporangiaceae bacterium]|jgi:SAM-dependent methyltransferase